MKITMVVGLILFVIVCVSIIAADSNRFHKVSYVVKTDKLMEPFHFVFLSDLHNKSYGAQNEELLKAIDDAAPQAVLIGGDILTAKPGMSLEPAIQFVGRLAEKYTIYYANGNHEQRLKLYPEKYGTMAQEYEQALAKRGIFPLVNTGRSVPAYQIRITGCEIDKEYYRRFHVSQMEKSYLDGILPPQNADEFQILLAHNPEHFKAYAAWGADLVLSGHVHGGIARIPGLGGVISPHLSPFPKYDGGMFREGGATMIVSRGLGSHTIPLRFCNPAELVEITLEPDEG